MSFFYVWFDAQSHLVVKPTYSSLLKLEETIPLAVNKKRVPLGCVHILGTVSVQGPGSEEWWEILSQRNCAVLRVALLMAVKGEQSQLAWDGPRSTPWLIYHSPLCSGWGSSWVPATVFVHANKSSIIWGAGKQVFPTKFFLRGKPLEKKRQG